MKLGCVVSPVDRRDYMIKPSGAIKLPETFEVKKPPFVHDQGFVMSCVAHTVAAIVECFNTKQQGDAIKFSNGWIYGHRDNNDYLGEGMYIRQALKMLHKYGCPTEYLFDNKNLEMPKIKQSVDRNVDSLKEYAYPNRITSYFRCNDSNSIKLALMNYGCVACSFEWYSDYELNNDYIIETDFNNPIGNHAVLIYGWNKTGWKVLNSWGESWGNKGAATIPYYIPRVECWGVTDNIINKNDIKKPIVPKFLAVERRKTKRQMNIKTT